MPLSLAASGMAQTNVTLSFQVAGKTRSSVVHVPSGTNKPAVVFFIHGANGSGAGFRSDTRGDAASDREKFIAVYPSASATGATGTWDDMRGTGNFPFFLALIDTLNARYQIDKSRIYMTGFSQGGFISFAAGCFYSDVFAAIAPVSGHAVSPCALRAPVPTFMTWGASEGTSFLADRDLWVGLNNAPAPRPPRATFRPPLRTPRGRSSVTGNATREAPCSWTPSPGRGINGRAPPTGTMPTRCGRSSRSTPSEDPRASGIAGTPQAARPSR